MRTPERQCAGWTPRLRQEGKVAVVFGTGHSPGKGLGNCRPAAIGEAHRRFGRLDVLHNYLDASLGSGDPDLMEVTEEAFDQSQRTNLRGTALACKHVLSIMHDQRSGTITNFDSAAAVGLHPHAPSTAVKAGVNAPTEQLALQNAKYNIRVNCIMPVLIDMPMAVGTRAAKWICKCEDRQGKCNAKYPLGRDDSGWDIANLAVFLGFDESNVIAGECILVNGVRVLNRI
jgi:NAD(P)-dependent dehydrogenase (short-subunit alcohol dehydrogenase family)